MTDTPEFPETPPIEPAPDEPAPEAPPENVEQVGHEVIRTNEDGSREVIGTAGPQ